MSETWKRSSASSSVLPLADEALEASVNQVNLWSGERRVQGRSQQHDGMDGSDRGSSHRGDPLEEEDILTPKQHPLATLRSLPKLDTTAAAALPSHDDYSTVYSRPSISTTGRRPSTASSSTSFGSTQFPSSGFHSLAATTTSSRRESSSSSKSFLKSTKKLTKSDSTHVPPTQRAGSSTDLKLEYPGPPRLRVPYLSLLASRGKTVSPAFEGEESVLDSQPVVNDNTSLQSDLQAHADWPSASWSQRGKGKAVVQMPPAQSSQYTTHGQHAFMSPPSTPTIETDRRASHLPRPSPDMHVNHDAPRLQGHSTSLGNRHVSQRAPIIHPVRSFLSTADSRYSLLEEAINTSDLSIYTTPQGEVRAGTFEGLLTRFIDNFNLRKDEGFRKVFLTGCIDLVTPEGLFSILVRRFEEASVSGPDGDSRQRIGIQTILFRIMGSWLGTRHTPITMVVLAQMRRFCQNTLRLETSPIIINSGNDLLQLIEQRAESECIPPNGSGFRCNHYPGHQIVKPKTPKELAIALTILASEKFSFIMPCDYLAYLREDKLDDYRNPIDIVRILDNRTAQWVKGAILHFDDIFQRAQTLKFFIHTAEECRKLHNFSSLIAITLALSSEPVARLKLTKKELPKNLRSQLDELCTIGAASNDHAAYHSELHDAGVYEHGQCVPWLARHLNKIHPILEHPDHSQVIILNNRPFLNLKRYSEFVRVFRETLPFKVPNLEKEMVRGHLAYLEERLTTVRVDDASEQTLIDRSLALEKQERRLKKNHTLELARLGFSRGS